MKSKRTSTKFSNTVGAVLITYTLILIIVGVFLHLITPDNFAGIVALLLGGGLAFFGINVARVTTENINGVNAVSEVAQTKEELPISLETGNQTISLDQK